MTPPPEEIDGTRVVAYAIFGPIVSPTGMTRHLVDGKFIHRGLAAHGIDLLV